MTILNPLKNHGDAILAMEQLIQENEKLRRDDEIGKQRGSEARAELRNRIDDLTVAILQAKDLIGAKNDSADEAVKAANINRAWHILHDVIGGNAIPTNKPKQCNHWPGQPRCGVCGMGSDD